jgi:hypothetical protein
MEEHHSAEGKTPTAETEGCELLAKFFEIHRDAIP